MERQVRLKLPIICPLAVSLTCLILAVSPETLSELLQYHRGELHNGAWWRLISAHFVHLGWGHLLMNLMGLWLIWYLFITDTHTGCPILIFIPLAIGTSAGLWLLSPELVWYRGLSGILHGLLIWALLNRFKTDPLLASCLLFGVAVKIGWEQWYGPLPGSESMANGNVVVASHLYGALSGALIWITERLVKLRDNQ